MQSKTLSLEIGIAHGWAVTVDQEVDARDPVIGPTLGVGYDSLAALKLWGVWKMEQDFGAADSWAVGFLFDIRLADL